MVRASRYFGRSLEDGNPHRRRERRQTANLYSPRLFSGDTVRPGQIIDPDFHCRWLDTCLSWVLMKHAVIAKYPEAPPSAIRYRVLHAVADLDPAGYDTRIVILQGSMHHLLNASTSSLLGVISSAFVLLFLGGARLLRRQWLERPYLSLTFSEVIDYDQFFA